MIAQRLRGRVGGGKEDTAADNIVCGANVAQLLREFARLLVLRIPSREHRCTGGEELVDQAIMETGVEVGAAVLNDRQTEISVGCFEQSGEDNAAGGDAVENQRVNVIGAEDHSFGMAIDENLGTSSFGADAANQQEH